MGSPVRDRYFFVKMAEREDICQVPDLGQTQEADPLKLTLGARFLCSVEGE
jgi:hypothetical protein